MAREARRLRTEAPEHRFFQLPCGTDLHLVRWTEWQDFAALGIAIDFGSSYARYLPPRLERPITPGLAHFMEHMCYFHAVRRHSREIDFVYGAGDFNAITTPSQTIWHATFIAGDISGVTGFLNTVLDVVLYPFHELPYTRKLTAAMKEDVQLERLYRWDSQDYRTRLRLRDCLFDESLDRADMLGERADIDTIDDDHVRWASSIIRANLGSILIASSFVGDEFASVVNDALLQREGACPATNAWRLQQPAPDRRVRQPSAIVLSKYEDDLMFGVKFTPPANLLGGAAARRFALDWLLENYKGYPANVWHYANQRIHYGIRRVDGRNLLDPVTAAGLPDTIRQELVRSLDDFFPIELLASRAAKRVRGDFGPSEYSAILAAFELSEASGRTVGRLCRRSIGQRRRNPKS